MAPSTERGRNKSDRKDDKKRDSSSGSSASSGSSRSRSGSSSSRSSSSSGSSSRSSSSRSRSKSSSSDRSSYASRRRHSRSVSPRRRKSPSPKPTKIHVGRLTRNVTKEHVLEIFSNYGTIRNVDMPFDRVHPHLTRGFAYIEFENADDAEKAIKFMDGGQVDGQEISATPVLIPKPRAPFGPPPGLRRPPPNWRRSPMGRRGRRSPVRYRSPRRRSRSRSRSPARRRRASSSRSSSR